RHASVAAHLGEIAGPEPGTSKLEDTPGLGSSDEVLEGSLDGSRVRLLATQTRDLVQQVLTKHKIRPFHVYAIPTGDDGGKRIGGVRALPFKVVARRGTLRLELRRWTSSTPPSPACRTTASSSRSTRSSSGRAG